jgi:hypothetical protein
MEGAKDGFRKHVCIVLSLLPGDARMCIPFRSYGLEVSIEQPLV